MVPGQIPKKYALKLGFKPHAIETGFYSCDLNRFESIYQSQKELKQTQFPKRFLYVGRYYSFKGIQELWQAFLELQQEHPNQWELWCLGVGDIEPIHHPKLNILVLFNLKIYQIIHRKLVYLFYQVVLNLGA